MADLVPFTGLIAGNLRTTYAPNVVVVSAPGGKVVVNSNIYIDGSGNVGVGTTSPTAKLHVANGGIVINNSPSGNVKLTTEYSSAGQRIAQLIQSNTSVDFSLVYTAIGNSDAPFDVYFNKTRSTDGITPAIVQNNDEVFGLYAWADDGTGFQVSQATIKAAVDGATSAGNVPGRLTFHTSPPNYGVGNYSPERMRIDRNGNVGIATTSPLAKLHVQGNTLVQGSTGFGSNAQILAGSSITVANESSGNLVLSTRTPNDTIAGFYSLNSYRHTGTSSQFSAPWINDVEVIPTITSNSTGLINTFQGIASYPTNYGAGNVAGLTGTESTPIHRGTGTVTEFVGFGTYPIVWNTGNVTNLRGVDVTPLLYSTGNVATSYGVSISPAVYGNGGFVTGNSYGVYISDHNTPATKGTGYNFYSVGATSKNVFEGKVSLGNTAPVITSNTAILTVNTSWSGDLAFADTPRTWWEGPAANGVLLKNTYNHTTATGVDISELYINPTMTQSSNSILRGIWVSPDNKSTGITDTVYGIECVTRQTGIGTTAYHTSIYANIDHQSNATITNSRTLQVDGVSLGSSGNVITSYGVIVVPPSTWATGKVTGNTYGIYIANHTTAATTGNAYNLYSVGTASKNVFEGSVGIGSSLPVSALNIGNAGNITLSASATTIGKMSILGTNGNEFGYVSADSSATLELYGYYGATFNAADGASVVALYSNKPWELKAYSGNTFSFIGYTGFGGEVIMKNKVDGTEVFHAYLADTYKTTFPNGNVGINTTSPAANLHVKGSQIITGNVGIGTATITGMLSGNALTVFGNINIQSPNGALLVNGVPFSGSGGGGVTTFSAGSTGFTPSTATTGAVTLAGTLATSNGGTGLSGATPFNANGLLYATSTSALTTTSQGGTNTVLIANAGAPSFSATPLVTSLTTTGVINAGGAAVVNSLSSNGAVSGTSGTFTGGLYGAAFNTAGTATVNALSSNGAVGGTIITASTGYEGGYHSGTIFNARTSLIAATVTSNGAVSGTSGTFTGGLYGAAFNTAGTATVNALASNGAVSGTVITASTGYEGGYHSGTIFNARTSLIAATITSNAGVSGTSGTFTGGLYGAAFNTAGTATVNALASNGAVSGTTITGSTGYEGGYHSGTIFNARTSLIAATITSNASVSGTTITGSTSVTSPIHYGGTTASSSLTLQSTSGAGTTDSILFKVGNAGAIQAAVIDTAGNVGISTTTIAAGTKLYVSQGNVRIGESSTNVGIIFSDGTFQKTAASGSGGGATITDDNSTNTNSQYPVMARATSGTFSTAYVASTDMYFNPSTGTLSSIIFNSLSDIAVKENITTIDNAVDTLNNLRGVSFNWKRNNRKSYGVIAQELERILPDLVDVNTDDGTKSVNYAALSGFFIEAIKELNTKINELNTTISELRNK